VQISVAAKIEGCGNGGALQWFLKNGFEGSGAKIIGGGAL